MHGALGYERKGVGMVVVLITGGEAGPRVLCPHAMLLAGSGTRDPAACLPWHISFTAKQHIGCMSNGLA